MVLVEAMASDLPVVATRCGGIPDVVTDGQTGLLVPERDAAALAAAAARAAWMIRHSPCGSPKRRMSTSTDGFLRRASPPGSMPSIAARWPRESRRPALDSPHAAGGGADRRSLVPGVYRTHPPRGTAAVQARLRVLGPLLGASVITVLTWFLLVRTWSGSLRWWGDRLAFTAAIRIWFITNLSRFVPGAIWQFAHVSAEALNARISPVAATGAILFQQIVLLGHRNRADRLARPRIADVGDRHHQPDRDPGAGLPRRGRRHYSPPDPGPDPRALDHPAPPARGRWPAPTRAGADRGTSAPSCSRGWPTASPSGSLGAPPGRRGAERCSRPRPRSSAATWPGSLPCLRRGDSVFGRPRWSALLSPIAGPGTRAASGHRVPSLARGARNSHGPRRARVAPHGASPPRSDLSPCFHD